MTQTSEHDSKISLHLVSDNSVHEYVSEDHWTGGGDAYLTGPEGEDAP